MQIEFTVVGRQFHDLFRYDQFFLHAPMGNQTLNRANAEAVLFLELHQLRKAGHGAVIVQDFAEHARGLQPGHCGKVDGCFRVAAPLEHAAVHRPQRKYCPGCKIVCDDLGLRSS